jgi:hypothetical protein
MRDNGFAVERPRFSAGRFNRRLARLSELDELCDRHTPPLANATSVKLDACDFMESFGRKVTRSTMWTADDGHFLNHKQRRSLSVAAGYRSLLVADAAAILAAFSCYSAYTARIYSI